MRVWVWGIVLSGRLDVVKTCNLWLKGSGTGPHRPMEDMFILYHRRV